MRILITLGGTGGHIYPAQDLAKELKSRGHEVYLAGDKGAFFSLTDFPYISIASGNIRKKNLLDLFKGLFLLFRGTLQSLMICKRLFFDVVIGMGSFHSVPILLASKMFRRKIVLFEPNIVCGLANRVFSRFSCFTATQFPILENHYAKKVYQTHFLPWGKSPIEQKKNKHLTFIVFGGSQGAEFLNQVVPLVVQRLQKIVSYFELIHITGKKGCIETIKHQYDSLKIASIVKKYETELLTTLSQCDFAVCRSGAGTIGDLMTSKTPAILIPYPYATDQHQEKNGAYFTNIVKGGVALSQWNCNEETLFQMVRKMIEKDGAELKKYRKNITCFYETNQQKASMAELIEAL